MEIKTYVIFSYCDDFTEEEQEILEDYGCDVFIEYTAYSREDLKKEGYSEDLIAIKLFELGAESGQKVLIHIDY